MKLMDFMKEREHPKVWMRRQRVEKIYQANGDLLEAVGPPSGGWQKTYALGTEDRIRTFPVRNNPKDGNLYLAVDHLLERLSERPENSFLTRDDREAIMNCIATKLEWLNTQGGKRQLGLSYLYSIMTQTRGSLTTILLWEGIEL